MKLSDVKKLLRASGKNIQSEQRIDDTNRTLLRVESGTCIYVTDDGKLYLEGDTDGVMKAIIDSHARSRGIQERRQSIAMGLALLGVIGPAVAAQFMAIDNSSLLLRRWIASIKYAGPAIAHWLCLLLIEAGVLALAFRLIGTPSDYVPAVCMADDSAASSDADATRAMIYQENALIHNRVTWMITFESLLFTALGLAMNSNALQSVVAHNLARAFAIAGITVAVTSMWGSVAQLVRFFELRLRYHEMHPRYIGTPVIGLDPPIWPRLGDDADWLKPIYRFGWFITVWNLLPITLVFSWLVVWYFIGGLSFESVVVGTMNTLAFLVLIALSMTTKWPSWFAYVHRKAAESTGLD